jgi:integrase
MKHPDYPGVSSFTDARGKTRWRFRGRDNKTVSINAEPHTPEFDRLYQCLLEGRRPEKAEVVRMPGAARPRTFDAAYRILRTRSEWTAAIGSASRFQYSLHIEEFLNDRIGGNGPRWGEAPVADFKRRHVKDVLSLHADTPHKEKMMLICLRKLIGVALDEEWCEVDPTHGIKRTPESDGHKAWPDHVMRQYEDYWPVGTPARTAYALALWLGNRRSDVATLRWDQLTTTEILIDGELRQVEGFAFTQFKGRERRKGGKKGTTLFLPIISTLAEALAPLDRTTETVLTTERDPSRGYRMQTLTDRMAAWTAEAGIAKGYRLHGLRKSLGVMLAHCDVSTRTLMDVLGHSSIAHAELYSREAEQKRLAVRGLESVIRMRR